MGWSGLGGGRGPDELRGLGAGGPKRSPESLCRFAIEGSDSRRMPGSASFKPPLQKALHHKSLARFFAERMDRKRGVDRRLQRGLNSGGRDGIER